MQYTRTLPTTDFEKHCKPAKPVHTQKSLQIVICNTTSGASMQWLGSSSVAMVDAILAMLAMLEEHDPAVGNVWLENFNCNPPLQPQHGSLYY